MKTWTIAGTGGALAGACVFALAIVLSGCPSSAEKKPAKELPHGPVSPARPDIKPEGTPPAAKTVEQPPKPANEPGKPGTREEKLTEEVEEMTEKPRDLGSPLVDEPDKLVRLDPKEPVWLDMEHKQVVLLGETCKAGYPLEFFATYANRAYESVLSVNVTPHVVHAGLLRVGAKSGHPARFQPEFSPPTGTEIAIEVRWKDPQGKVQSARAQDWVRNIKTKKALDVNWVFAGSMFVKDETTGQEFYVADHGEMICVLSSPGAMLDLPMLGYGALEARSFEAFAEHLPPEGTPVTLLLKPILGAKPAANEAPATAEKKAALAAEPWLALVDQGEYSRSWETAAELLKDAVDRREFIRKVGEARKPLGKVISRTPLSAKYTTALPGAPDGQYVIIQYKTVFEKKAAAVETVTPMLDKDKKWRVSGYYIK